MPKTIRSYLKSVYLTLERSVLKYKKKKDILFLIRNELMFQYAYEIQKVLERDQRLRLWYCCINPDLFLNFPQVRIKYSLKTLPYKIARWIKWDLVLYPDHGPCFRADTSKIYTGHGFYTGKLVNGEPYLLGSRSLYSDGTLIYKKILLPSHFTKEGAKKYYPRFYPAVKVVGNLHVDRLKETQKKCRREFPHFDSNKMIIGFGSTWAEASLVQRCGMDLVKALPRLAEEYNIIITLHLYNYHSNPKYTQGKDWRKIFNEISSKNIYVATPDEGLDLLTYMDLLVVDHTSLGLYFPLLSKPMIFFDNEVTEYEPLSMIMELRNYVPRIYDFKNINHDIKEAIAGFTEESMKEMSEIIVSYVGQSSNRHIYEICDSLQLRHPAE